MNLLLLEPEEINAEGIAVIGGRRAEHILNVLRPAPSDYIKAGVVGGMLGRARVLDVGSRGAGLAVHLRFEPTAAPPAPLPVRLILALPRPKVLRRVLSAVTSLGVKEIHLINAYKVEKPYWTCEQIQPEAIREACILGLEQAVDTVLPQVHLHRLFKPFVEDQVPGLIRGGRALVAHPGESGRVAGGPDGRRQAQCLEANATTLTSAIGPEGGFIPYEVELLESAGFQRVSLGPRILKVETAIPVLISSYSENFQLIS